jgi:hypothetical protein
LARIRISSTDLTALIAERLQRFSGCPNGFPVAVVPDDTDKSGWSVVMNLGMRRRHPSCVRRVATIAKQLRRIYVLTEDDIARTQRANQSPPRRR